MTTDSDALAERVVAGDRRAIARAITEMENDSRVGQELARAVASRPRHALVVGLTGPPGAGKSTLVRSIVERVRADGRRTSVLLVDPSSPVTGGAVLGDRVRIKPAPRDDGLFIRSLAARGHLGGTTRSTRRIVDVLAASGMDVILIETVGTGQSEAEVVGLAHCTIVVCPPGLGDDIQAIKAGILEVADILVVNKADLPGAARTVASLEAGGHGHRARIVQTVATTGAGVDDLLEAIHECGRRGDAPHPRLADARRVRLDLAAAAAHLVRRHIEVSPAVEELCDELASGRVELDAAARDAVRIVLEVEG